MFEPIFPLDASTRLAFSAAGSVVAFSTHLPYVFNTFRGTTKPHVFTWLIWTVLYGIAFAGQMAGNGGAGAWVTAVMGVISATVLLAGLQQGRKNITRFDLGCLFVSFSAILVWIWTSTPVWSILLITGIDAVAFAPTIRKSFPRPYEETLVAYAGNIAKWSFSIAAMEVFSLTTVLYPGSLVISNTIFVGLLLVQRSRLKHAVRS